MMQLDQLLALPGAAVRLVANNVACAQPRVQYSAIAKNETRLPEGMRPASLLGNRTGSLLVGDFLSSHRSELERAADASFRLVREVAAVLPVDAEDERIVDALLAKRTASLATRPLRRREGEPR